MLPLKQLGHIGGQHDAPQSGLECISIRRGLACPALPRQGAADRPS